MGRGGQSRLSLRPPVIPHRRAPCHCAGRSLCPPRPIVCAPSCPVAHGAGGTMALAGRALFPYPLRRSASTLRPAHSGKHPHHRTKAAPPAAADAFGESPTPVIARKRRLGFLPTRPRKLPANKISIPRARFNNQPGKQLLARAARACYNEGQARAIATGRPSEQRMLKAWHT